MTACTSPARSRLEDVLARIHVECLTGDLFGGPGCGCRELLRAALERVAAAGQDVVVYIREAEFPGVDVLRGLRSRPADTGRDAIAVDRHSRERRVATQVLLDLGIRSVRLLTGPAGGEDVLSDGGIPVSGHDVPPPRLSRRAGRERVPG